MLAASAMGAFFLKPTLAGAVEGDKKYLVSIKTIGYGYLWPEEVEGTEDMSFFEPDDAEHSTIDAGPDNARIHSIEFDVFCR